MKFALCVPSEFKEHYVQHQGKEITGLLQWGPVLGADVLTINEDLSSYDVVLLNYSSTETEYGSVVRQQNPDCTLIACFDYGFDVVGTYFVDLSRIKTVMDRCQIIYSVNRNQRDWIKQMFPERDVHYIPHPTDIDYMRQFRRPLDKRDNELAVAVHQYDWYHLQSLEVIKAAERILKRSINKILVGLKTRIMQEKGIRVLASSLPLIGDDHPDEKLRGQPIDPALPNVVQQCPPGIGYDSVLPYLGVQPWYSLLGGFRAALDLYTVNSIGRFGIDCAGVGVPCVASEKQDSSKQLWPFTTVDPFDCVQSAKMLAKVLSKPEFCTHALQVAEKNLAFYGFAKSKERMLRVLEEYEAKQ